MKLSSLIILIIVFFLACAKEQYCGRGLLHVETGLDELVKSNFVLLEGKSVGLITNHTGLTKDGKHVADLLHGATNINLSALFGPEHGIRGNQPGGLKIKSVIDSITAVPVYSLYTENKKPTKEMLRDLQVLVFDIQDVGARFYTYIYTMALAMEAAAKHNKQFIVLDRPNPINGEFVEGPMLKEGFESFVGLYKIPVRHGMTVGELATMFKEEGWIAGADSLDLKVIQMTGWRRSSWLDESDVPWLSPSPNMKSLNTATVYPGICFLEGTNVSEGRGTDKPFEKIGAPWIDAQEFAKEMNKHNLPGISFEPIEFTPKPSSAEQWLKFKEQTCRGVYLNVKNRQVYLPVRTGISVIRTLKELYPDEFRWSKTIDRLYGSDQLRTGVDAGKPLEYFFKKSDDFEKFVKIRDRYLLYDDNNE